MGALKVLWTTCVNWSKLTSISGINNAANAKSKTRSFAWLIIFSIGLYLTMTSVYSVVTDYYKHPITTSTSLTHQSVVTFPAITVCNQNRIHCAHLLEEVLVHETINETNPTEESDKDLKNLEKMFDVTGCAEQACSTVQSQISSTRDNTLDNTWSDNLLVTMPSLGCQAKGDDKDLFCYHLKYIKDIADGLVVNYTGTVPNNAEIKKANMFFDCMEEDACCYEPKGEGKKDDEEMNYPPSCPKRPLSYQCKKGGEHEPNRKKRALGDGSIVEKYSPNKIDDDDEPPPKDVSQGAEFLKLYMETSAEIRKKIGHQLTTKNTLLGEIKGLISSCLYRNRACTNETLWYPIITTSYGACYTFNSKKNTRDKNAPRSASLTGIENGMSIELFLDQDNYMLEKLSRKAGARLVIHDPNQAPFPDEYGHDLQPNTASSVAIQLNAITRMAAPYESNCSDDWETSGFNSNYTQIEYSLASCQRLCLQEQVVELCGCYQPSLVQEFATTPLLIEEKKVCNTNPISNNTDFMCYMDILDGFANRTRNCDNCHVSCNEKQFSSAITSATWPSNQYWVELAVSLGYDESLMEAKGPQALEAKAKIQEDFAKADIYYQTLNVQEMKQSAKYSNFLSGLGGALSIYMGVATFMLFELAELLIDIFFNIWKSFGKAGKEIAK